jgi:hypothetical protein
MLQSEPDANDELRDHYRDLATLRRLAKERESLDRDSAEWLEHQRTEEALARKIRDWASRSDEPG